MSELIYIKSKNLTFDPPIETWFEINVKPPKLSNDCTGVDHRGLPAILYPWVVSEVQSKTIYDNNVMQWTLSSKQTFEWAQLQWKMEGHANE